MGYRLGVDLGTTFVAAARSDDSQIEMVTLGDRSVVMPSVVFVGEDGDTLSGEAADRRAVSSPERVARQFKRRLGDPTPMRLGEASYSATDLLAVLLREVLARVTTTEGEPPGQVVLTHPANWGPYRREVFEEVPRAAGLSEVLALTEPEAAAMHYAATRRLNNGELVAVYDLGGGTFDATVIRKTPDGVATLGTPEGVERLGGIDFDQALFDFVNYASDGALNEVDMGDPKTVIALARLRQDCVLAKESLSVDTETLVPVFLPRRQLDVRITRADFENLIRAQIESTITALSRALRTARVTADELNAVLLIGGSSRIPLVAHMVSEELARPILVDTHPKYAVALGAATPTNQPVARRATAPVMKPGGARRPRSVRSTQLRTGAAVLALTGIATLVWTLTSLPSTPSGPTALALPAVLPPPVHVMPPVRNLHWQASAPVLDMLSEARLSEVDAVTLAPRWTVDLPKPGSLIHGFGDESLCVNTGPSPRLTECTLVDRVSRTVGPVFSMPAGAYTMVPADEKNMAILSDRGTLNVMDKQTRAVRSVPVAGSPPLTAAHTLFGAGGHRAYVVGDDEAPTPILTVVDTNSMAVTTVSWPRATRPPHPRGTSYLVVSPDGRSLYALAGQDLLVFDTETMTPRHTIPQHAALIDNLSSTANGRYLFLLTDDGELRVIEASTGRRVSSGRTRAHARALIEFDRGRKVVVVAGDGGYDLFDTSAFAGH